MSAEPLTVSLSEPSPGVAVVEVRTDRATHRSAHAELRARARAALGLH